MKNKLFGRILVWILVVGMLLPLLVGVVGVFSVNQSEVDALRQKRNNLAAMRQNAEKELAALKQEISSILQRKELLDQKMGQTAEEIELTDALLAALDEEMAAQNEEIRRLEKEEATLYEKFKTRLRVLYEEGGASYLEVLLCAESFTQLLDRIDMVELVLAQDKELIASLQNVRAQSEETFLALEANRAETAALRGELEESKIALEADIAEAASLIVTLQSEEADSQGLLSQVASQEKQADAAFSAAAKALEKQRKEEEERKKREEEERRRKEQEQQAQKPPANPNPSGTFTWPLPGHINITSPFGWRTHPITKLRNYHSGVDVGAPNGTPILAAAGGTVLENTYNSTFGYYVRIDHGNGYITLYGHMRSKGKPAAGSTVTKGAVIGYVGSTGMSTGNHLHFTMYRNGVLVNPLNYVQKY